MDTQKFPPCPYCGSTEMRTGFQTYEATVKKQRGSMMGGSALQHLFCGRCGMVAASRVVPFPVSWTVKMKKKQKETQDILSYHSQAAGCSDKARAKASGGRQPIEECGRTGL